MDITIISVGVIRSPFTDPTEAPIQSARSTVVENVQIGWYSRRANH